MACGSCGGRKRGQKIAWRTTYKDGRPPQVFATELEARAAAEVSGGTYTRVTVK